MARIRNMKIGTRLVVLVGGLVILVVAMICVMIGINIQRMVRGNVETIATETAGRYAKLIQAEIEVPLDEARALIASHRATDGAEQS